MAAAKTATQTPTVLDSIQQAFADYLSTESKYPASITAFAKAQGIDAQEVYDTYGSLRALDKSIHEKLFVSVGEKLEEDETFSAYSAREKVLALNFTYFESLKPYRGYLEAKRPHGMCQVGKPYLPIQDKFKEAMQEILGEAKASGEVPARQVLDNAYPLAFWGGFNFLFQFWLKDDSKGFERTDAAIEKSVNLAFDLVGKGPLDTIFDFGKFLFQNRS